MSRTPKEAIDDYFGRGYTILSDKQIRKLCVPPAYVYDPVLYLQNQSNQAETDWSKIDLGKSEAIQAAAKLHEDRLKGVRPVSQEVIDAFVPMISPFVEGSVRREKISDDHEDTRRVLSYGRSSYGYDVRLAEEFVIFSNINSVIVDPKRPDPKSLIKLPVHVDEDNSKYVIMPPNSYGMGHTIEYFNMPRDITAICLGKSTYARSCVHINVTPIEAEFKGQVVIEMSNSSGLPVKIYLNEGIAQLLFLQGGDCEVSYADRGGKYQGQTGLTLAKI